VFLAGIGVFRDKIEIQLLLNRQLFSVQESHKKACVVNEELKTQAENAINMIKLEVFCWGELQYTPTKKTPSFLKAFHKYIKRTN
jgi:hypothetical protein